ncbi:hypothetical protein Vi05172_g5620 [Venturia inaequalis]|nr:hypothetical protein Vi05172_g5620 [Venturia inaequalis]
MYIKRALYGLAESGLYWFKTYHAHHVEKLDMRVSSYDPCLLFTTSGRDVFAITGLQTDDTFSFVTEAFSIKEEAELTKAGFRAKGKTTLAQDQPVEFNGARIRLDNGDIIVEQKGQADRLQIIDPRAKDAQQQYVEQRARGAYIAATC